MLTSSPQSLCKARLSVCRDPTLFSQGLSVDEYPFIKIVSDLKFSFSCQRCRCSHQHLYTTATLLGTHVQSDRAAEVSQQFLFRFYSQKLKMKPAADIYTDNIGNP